MVFAPFVKLRNWAWLPFCRPVAKQSYWLRYLMNLPFSCTDTDYTVEHLAVKIRFTKFLVAALDGKLYGLLDVVQQLFKGITLAHRLRKLLALSDIHSRFVVLFDDNCVFHVFYVFKPQI